MNTEQLIEIWKKEEEIAHVHGWDFSHVDGRCIEESPPWSYRDAVQAVREPRMRLLDIDTGGGEFLLTLGHPPRLTAVTESYPPNVRLCRETLSPLGIDVREADAAEALPFADASFDLVINRHGSFNAPEIARVLVPGGYFVTQQVGAENDRELVELLLPGTPQPFPEEHAELVASRFAAAGFEILRCEESFRPIRFYDVGALVWFARIIEWEFPGFSVDRCLPQLLAAQRIVEERGFVEGRAHRILLVARHAPVQSAPGIFLSNRHFGPR